MFKEAADARLLLLINKLSKVPEIYEKFYLAGGTALALQLGHRKSFDIDLFYFTDVEDSPDPVSLKNIRWDEIKDFLISNEKMLTESLLI